MTIVSRLKILVELHHALLLLPLRTVGSTQGSVYQFIFEPFHSYGVCTFAYSNGFENSARFNDKLDTSKELS